MSSFMWPALRPHYRCIAVDIPGLGLSRTPLLRGQGFSKMADALQAFVHALGLEEFVLIAHATGGPSGLELAVRERARVRGLVLSNTFAWPLALLPKLRPIVRVVSSWLFSFLVVRFNLLQGGLSRTLRERAAGARRRRDPPRGTFSDGGRPERVHERARGMARAIGRTRADRRSNVARAD